LPSCALIASSTIELNTSGRCHRRARRIDHAHDLRDLLRRIDERNGAALKIEGFELRQQAVAEHFGGDAGAIGNKKDGAPIRRMFTVCTGGCHQSCQTGVRPSGSGGMLPRST
jgi:hypothetical protein